MPYFTIIGICETPEQAVEIAAQLYHHIEQIVRWHLNHPFKSKKLADKPSPAELEIAKQYNLTWHHLHDWLMVDLEDIQETITVLDNWIFLTSGETDAPPQPFDKLVEALGARVAIDRDSAPLPVTIRAKISQPHIIADAITAYITRDGLVSCPWMVYVDGEKNAQADRWLGLESAYLDLMRQFRAIDNHPALAPHKGKPNYETHMLALMDDIFAEQSHLTFEDVTILDDMREACALIPRWDDAPHMPPYPTHVTITGDEIALQNVMFGEIASGLPALLAWLRAEGASNIRYELA